MTTEAIPEGYELAEVSAAKNIAHEALVRGLEAAGYDPDGADDGPDLINLADRVVEALTSAGVTIPESIIDPHTGKRAQPEADH